MFIYHQHTSIHVVLAVIMAIRLFAIVLRGWHIDLSCFGGLWLAGESRGELGKCCLVGTHADSQTLEIVELVGKADCMAIHINPVAVLVHGRLELLQKVLAQAHWPAHAASIDSADVLVHQTVDLADGVVNLDSAGREDLRKLTTWRQTLLLLNLHISEGSDVHQKIAKGRKVLALALAHIGHNLLLSSDSVCLQGEVVVSDHL